MSIVIQKKRLNKKAPVDYAQKVSAFEKRDPLHEKFFDFFTDFETEFKKTIGQTSLRNLRITLDAFYKSLKTDEFLLTDLSKQADPISNKSENTFLINRASEVVNLLADYVIDRRNLLPVNRRTWDPLDRQSCDTKEITLLCVKILKLFCIVNLQFSLQLSNNTKFCSRMFSLMLQDNKMYFKQILSIMESLIASNPEIMKPAIYPFMQDVLTNMSKKHFARFSRIIALFVLEANDKMDFKELSINYSDNKMIKIHSFLLSVPDLIETYTIILEHLTKITETLMSTTTQTLSTTAKFLIGSNLIKDSGLNLGFLKPLFGQCDISESLAAEVFCPKFIVKFIVKKSNLTEILFIISNLLQSKRKFEVQGILRQINFLERALIPLLDYLFHDDLDNDATNDPFYSEDVGCTSPLATTRIQLLRIFISFCDRDTQNISNKELLISSEEKNILYSNLIHGGLAAHHPTYSETEGFSKRPEKASRLIGQISVDCKDPAKPFFTEEVLKNNAFASAQKKGLLSKIISLFDKFSPDSNYRFWLASCVEAFLRGFHEPHQIFVAHSGLLYTLMNEILDNGITKQTNIQISYDLIGEIVKFNKYNMAFLEKMCEKFGWMNKLAESALTNVIDSNVFLRALLLSFERFNFTSKNGVSFNEHSKIFRTFANEAPKLFYMITEALEPNEINQDNICCVNTILIMAILAEQKGELEKYIDLLEADKADDRNLLKEFSEVLSIWYRYYMSKTKDCYSLEFTTAIPFFYYQDMKNTLQSLLEKRVSKM